MSDFDAELYLRLLGERQLLSRDANQGGRATPLDGAADALLAVGVVDRTVADAVLDDYGLATALRSPHGQHRRTMMRRWSQQGGPPVELSGQRVASIGVTLDALGGTLELRHVRFGEDTQVAFGFQASNPRPSQLGHTMTIGHGPGQLPWGSPAPTLRDDQGASAVATFSGGGGGSGWTGTLHAAGLSPATRWLELDGVRVPLGEAQPGAAVSIEELPPAGGAERYLWHRLAVPERPWGRPGQLEPGIDALIAAGALAADDDVIERVRTVAARLPSHPGMGMAGPSGGRLPQPWQSLVARVGRDDGPVGTVATNAQTPEFAGHRVAVLALDSNAGAFSAEIEVTPNVMAGGEGSTLAWWARDDRGNHYLGSAGSWSGDAQHGRGTLGFWPALDPVATMLELMPTALTHRAIIAMPLAFVVPRPLSALEPPP